MANIIDLLTSAKKEIVLGEVVERSGNKYSVNMRDRTVAIESTLTGVIPVGSQVYVTTVDNQLRIIAKATVKNREREEVIVNG